MKTIVNSTYPAPEFDTKIADWLATYETSEHDFPDAPRRVGILLRRDDVSTVYRAIDGAGVSEIGKAYDFLESIGLRDLAIYDHPRFNCIYGLPEHRPQAGEKLSVILWD
ncbi:hypothetical protein [Janthinobacterium kumbetense]|jgi:hypothetical protein|uniref:Uncharacterized protein n=1 Tax=Janthinobacterium kumbetense TaxID=2950280 RepID=A0ABT0WWD4_9BURK|nr:hypothetical protein [Janthinobacterium kumbetense]MCM2567814.1 hypothetical protein [Janthinobacterium kumbetense]